MQTLQHNVVCAVQFSQKCADLHNRETENNMSTNARTEQPAPLVQGSAVLLHQNGKGHHFEDCYLNILARVDSWFERGRKEAIHVKLGWPSPPDNFTPIHILRALRASSDTTTMTLIMQHPSRVKSLHSPPVELTKPSGWKVKQLQGTRAGLVTSALWYCHTSLNQNIILSNITFGEVEEYVVRFYIQTLHNERNLFYRDL